MYQVDVYLESLKLSLLLLSESYSYFIGLNKILGEFFRSSEIKTPSQKVSISSVKRPLPTQNFRTEVHEVHEVLEVQNCGAELWSWCG